jgi:hypothetical protein
VSKLRVRRLNECGDSTAGNKSETKVWSQSSFYFSFESSISENRCTEQRLLPELDHGFIFMTQHGDFLGLLYLQHCFGNLKHACKG